MDDLMRHLNMPERPIKQEPVDLNAVQQADAFLEAARDLLSPSRIVSANTQAVDNAATSTTSVPALSGGTQQTPGAAGLKVNGLHPARILQLQFPREVESNRQATPSQHFSKGANAEPLGKSNGDLGRDKPGAEPRNAPSQSAIMRKPTSGSRTPQLSNYAESVSALNNRAAQRGHRVKYDVYKRTGTDEYYGSVHIGAQAFHLRYPQDTASIDARDAKTKLAKLGLQELGRLAKGNIKYSPSLAQVPAGYQRPQNSPAVVLKTSAFVSHSDRSTSRNDGRLRKRKASPGRNGAAQVNLYVHPAKRVATGPANLQSFSNGPYRKSELNERQGAREGDAHCEGDRDGSWEEGRNRPRQTDYYPSRSLASPNRYRPRSCNPSRDRERDSYRDQQRKRARFQDFHGNSGPGFASRSSPAVHASDDARPPLTPNADAGSSRFNTPTDKNDYASKVERLASLLNFNQPVVYFMPSDPVRSPNSIFSGSVHFPGHAVAGTDGAAVLQIENEPVAGADAAKQLLYKEALAWLQRQQDDRERALKEQLQKLREFKVLEDEPIEEAEY